jgi:hypothetical protein
VDLTELKTGSIGKNINGDYYIFWNVLAALKSTPKPR